MAPFAIRRTDRTDPAPLCLPRVLKAQASLVFLPEKPRADLRIAPHREIRKNARHRPASGADSIGREKMLATTDPFVRHFVQPVPRREPVEVRLFAGERRLTLEVGRPMDFRALTLLSERTCSKRSADLAGFGPRALAKRAIGRWSKPIDAGLFLDTRHIEPNNVSHLLMDIVPLCLSARRAVGDAAFVFRPLQPAFRDLLLQFGIDPLCTYRPVSGEKLSFRLARGLSQFGIEAHFDAPLYSYTGEVYTDHGAAPSGRRKLFISRRGPRSPLNAAQLDAMLEARGFTVVYMEDHAIPDQIALMQEADDVVAIHGAALAYLALKARTSRVIEIMPPSVYHDHFPIGIGHKVDRYVQLIPSFDENVQYQGWAEIYRHKQSPFHVDLAQLEEALDESTPGAGGREAGKAAPAHPIAMGA
ncbi:uncharacterized protein DUF563 [Novosphingobium sp. PhB57]|nr:uncharacterized protein DUF563 [Novosphingobium sp. PhB57]